MAMDKAMKLEMLLCLEFPFYREWSRPIVKIDP